MPDETRLDHQPWSPGSLLPGVAVLLPNGVTQQLAMLFISKALAKGQNPTPLDNAEVTISITDDAIHHMMRKD